MWSPAQSGVPKLAPAALGLGGLILVGLLWWAVLAGPQKPVAPSPAEVMEAESAHSIEHGLDESLIAEEVAALEEVAHRFMDAYLLDDPKKRYAAMLKGGIASTELADSLRPFDPELLPDNVRAQVRIIALDDVEAVVAVELVDLDTGQVVDDRTRLIAEAGVPETRFRIVDVDAIPFGVSEGEGNR